MAAVQTAMVGGLPYRDKALDPSKFARVVQFEGAKRERRMLCNVKMTTSVTIAA